MARNANFQATWPELKPHYDARFEYYLLSCAGDLRARNIQVWQVVMTKYGTGTRQPVKRDFEI